VLAAIGVESASTVAIPPLTVGSQRLVHRLGQPAVHTLDHVAVGVEGDAYAGVAQELLDVLGMFAHHEEYRSVGVPEIVQPCAGVTEP
jgi:hypothetical protein